MKRPFRGIALFFLSCFLLLTPAYAAEISVKLDETPIAFDTAPFLENDRVLVPVRGILESLGYSLYWQEESQTVLAINDEVSISLTIDSSTAVVNGELVSIDAPAIIRNGRTFVPLRFLAEYSGAAVVWDGSSSTVSITPQAFTAETFMKRSVVYIQTNKIQGSGIVLSADGLIATNFHVVEDASTMQLIFYNGMVYQGPVTIVGLSPDRDIALLQLEAEGLFSAEISDSYAIGDSVSAVGAPHGVRNTITTGTIDGFNQDTISTSAAITQGSSGGGLFDAEGRLIGMTYAFRDDQYFSIPVSRILQVPRDMALPLENVKDFTYTPKAPENLSFRKNGQYAYVSWASVYKSDYYHVYTSDSKNGNYTRLKNTALKTDYWYWGFPQAFGISINPRQPYYMKVSAVVNGVETPLSEPLKISR